MHRFQLIDQKLNSKRYFRLQVVTHLFTIQFATKKFIPKILIKIHRFHLIDPKLNSKGFFRPLVVGLLFKLCYPKMFIFIHRIQALQFQANPLEKFLQKHISLFLKSLYWSMMVAKGSRTTRPMHNSDCDNLPSTIRPRQLILATIRLDNSPFFMQNKLKIIII